MIGWRRNCATSREGYRALACVIVAMSVAVVRTGRGPRGRMLRGAKASRGSLAGSSGKSHLCPRLDLCSWRTCSAVVGSPMVEPANGGGSQAGQRTTSDKRHDVFGDVFRVAWDAGT
ncbi:hypothetical protein BC567DRAFT_224852 [Phyllosticta citribraziliensis]